MNCVNCGHDEKCHRPVRLFNWLARWNCNKQWGLIPDSGKLQSNCYCKWYTPDKAAK